MWNKYRQMISFVESATHAKIILRECFSEGDDFNAQDDRIISAICDLDCLIGYLVDESAELKAWHQGAVNDHNKQMEADAAALEKLNEAKAKAESEGK